ncbi:MAG: sulfotransferase [Pseudomonadota bacterium]|nr:sulfotransferase [Pseudomonadota bacterium]
MLRRLSLAYGVLSGTFRVRFIPLFVVWLYGGLRAWVFVAQALDNLVFPALGRTKVERPIVIVGNPRTGTTFLHRFLVENRFGSGMHLYRSLYPSIVLQKVLRPFLPLLEKVSPARFHKSAAHETDLSSVETDDVSVFFRYFDGFFLYGFFLAWDPEDRFPMFDPNVRDTTARDFDWLEAAWRRSLVAQGSDRIVAKLFSTGPRTPAFLKRFPDAHILYMVRDPVDVIPSTFSLVTGVLDKAFGYSTLPADVRDRYNERLYVALVDLFRRFHADWTSGRIDRSRVMVVSYDRMMQDFDGLMAEMIPFFDMHPTEAQLAAIRKTAHEQRAYQSKHTYKLEKYGLDADRIRRDCAFVYETWLTPAAPPVSAGSAESA